MHARFSQKHHNCQLEDELGTKTSQIEMTDRSGKNILVTKVLRFPVLPLLKLIYIRGVGQLPMIHPGAKTNWIASSN